MDDIEKLNQQFQGQPTETVLRWAWDRFGERAAIGTSFQGAGLVMIHLALKTGLQLPVFTLDTGLLFPETLALKSRLEQFFGIQIATLQPSMSLKQQEEVLGPGLWLRDPDLCCTHRKVYPLQERLETLDCWITGLRREQSSTRAGADMVEAYVLNEATGRDIIKLNPMAHWSRDAIWQHIRDHKIPYNPLHDQGYRSIGCQPCTQKSGAGGEERAGRWTGFNKTECGIHTFMARKSTAAA